MTTRRLVTSTLLAVALAGGFVRGSDGPKPAATPGPGEPTRQVRDVVAEERAGRSHDDQPRQVAVTCEKGRRQDENHAAGERQAGSLDQRRPEDDAERLVGQKVEI